MFFFAKKKTITALLIVDMQATFSSANDETTIKNCIIEIKKAIIEKMPIIVLEYLGHSRTLPELRKYLDKYKSTLYVTKRDDDGGKDVIKAAKKKHLKIDTFIVCGVNAACCVAETVRTLTREYNKEVKVVKKACNGFRKNSADYTFNHSHARIYQDDNVILI